MLAGSLGGEAYRPYGRPLRRALAWSCGGVHFLMGDVPLDRLVCCNRSVCVIVKRGLICRVERDMTSRGEKGRNMSNGKGLDMS